MKLTKKKIKNLKRKTRKAESQKTAVNQWM